MVKYLQMDGVDDYLKTPSITFNQVVFSFLLDGTFFANNSSRYLFDARTGTGAGLIYNGTFENGVPDNDFWTYYNSQRIDFGYGGFNSIPKDTNVELVMETIATNVKDDVNFFSHNNGASNGKGNLYNIKFFNAGVLVAHYDMSTGTVLDQSGNGNHAILVGGTWIDEGGTTTPIDAGGITLSSSTNLTSSGSKRTNGQTALQSISNLSIAGARVSTGESNLNIQTTLQGEGSRIRGNGSNLNAITSLIAEGEILSLDISVNLSASTSLDVTGTKISTGESILSANGNLLSTGTVIYNGESILVADTNLSALLGEGLIGTITLEGSRELNVYLIGNRELNITLQGNRQLHVTLQGSV
jgi:hypothetical protein